MCSNTCAKWILGKSSFKKFCVFYSQSAAVLRGKYVNLLNSLKASPYIHVVLD
jgi:hypothetical protein